MGAMPPSSRARLVVAIPPPLLLLVLAILLLPGAALTDHDHVEYTLSVPAMKVIKHSPVQAVSTDQLCGIAGDLQRANIISLIGIQWRADTETLYRIVNAWNCLVHNRPQVRGPRKLKHRCSAVLKESCGAACHRPTSSTNFLAVIVE